MLLQAFLSPAPVLSARHSSVSRTARQSRRPSVRCCEDSLDPSWRVYSVPGNKCVVCVGRGHSKCLFCFGEGTIRIGPEAARDTETCPQCSGTKVEQCVRCEGSGIRPNFRFDENGQKVPNFTNDDIRAMSLEESGINPNFNLADEKEGVTPAATNGVARGKR